MKKKKLLTLLLCAALLASVLTGCGSTSKTTAAYYNSAADSAAAQENSKAEEAANSIGISATGAGENLADQKLVKRSTSTRKPRTWIPCWRASMRSSPHWGAM